MRGIDLGFHLPVIIAQRQLNISDLLGGLLMPIIWADRNISDRQCAKRGWCQIGSESFPRSKS